MKLPDDAVDAAWRKLPNKHLVSKKDTREAISAFLTSLSASGYAVVPLEATNRMLTHMAECKCLTELWRAGVAAAQKETGE